MANVVPGQGPSAVLTIWVHDEKFSQNDIVLNPLSFPAAKPGTIARVVLHSPQKPELQNIPAKSSFCFVVKEVGKDLKNLQISVSSHIAQQFGFTPRSQVLVSLVEKELIESDYIEISFKDQYLDRGDMWRLAMSLNDQCVYSGMRISFAGVIRAVVKAVYVRNAKCRTGYVNASKTRPIFRTESSQFILMIQMSKEMWEFEEDGELVFNKAIDGFLPELFDRWRVLGAHHVVTIVLFTRILYQTSDETNRLIALGHHESMASTQDEWDHHGRKSSAASPHGPYKDFFKVVVENMSSTNWANTLLELKREFLQFQTSVLVQEITRTDGSTLDVISGKFCYACQGNLLEAINMAADQFNFEAIDRDLLRSGLSIVIVSPGTGRFDVNENLLRTTTEMLTTNGIGIDLVCLSKMPLHSVPLFCYYPDESWKDAKILAGSTHVDVFEDSDSEDLHVAHRQMSYALPHWMDVSFWAHRHYHERFWSNRFTSRCKMHELQMMGVMQNEMKSISIDTLTNTQDEYENYDSQIFFRVSEKKNNNIVPKSRLEPEKTLKNRPSVFSSVSRVSMAASNLETDKDGLLIDYDSSKETLRIETKDLSEMPESNDSKYDKKFRRGSKAVLDQYNYLRNLTDRFQTGKGNHGTARLIGGDTRKSPWQILSNPFNPSQNTFSLSSHFRRWQHVFPRPLYASSVKWKSMCMPAMLPLSTEYLPTESSLTSDYNEYSYFVSVDPDTWPGEQTALLQSMVCQRLAHGFQIAVSSNGRYGASQLTGHHGGPSQSSGMPNSGGPLCCTGPVVFLCLGQKQIHRLSCDPSGYNIEVRRYVLKSDNSVPVTCDSFMWGKSSSTYKCLTRTFSPKSVDYLNWNAVDQILSGADDTLTDSVRFWKIRFVLIPSEISQSARNLIKTQTEELNDEEIRLAGIVRLGEAFQRAQWIPPEMFQESSKPRRKDVIGPDMVFTTLRPSQLVRSESENLLYNNPNTNYGLFAGSEEFDTKTKIEMIANELQTENGIKMKDRRWHWRLYENIFSGNDMVTWLVENFRDIQNRTEATAFGNKLMDAGLFEHVDSRHRFLDGHYFYFLSPQYIVKQSKSGWFATRKANEGSSQLSQSSSASGSISSRKKPVQSVPDTTKQPRSKVLLSRMIKLNLDQQGSSYRPEIVQLHYDRIHNPEQCFHIRMEWMNITARFVLQSLASWARTAAHHGLRLVEAPVNEISQVNKLNPLADCIRIKLACEPPQNIMSSLNKRFSNSSKSVKDTGRIDSVIANAPNPIAILLIEKFDFVLERESKHAFSSEVDVTYSWGKPIFEYDQYIHRSGVAFVQIVDQMNIVFLANRAYMSRIEATGSSAFAPSKVDPNSLFAELQGFCSDKLKLELFYRSLLDDTEST